MLQTAALHDEGMDDMSDKRMYFGTKEYMTWVKCPAIDADISEVGWTSTSNFLNGGANVRNSVDAARVYNFSWNLASDEDIYEVLDFARGVYGSGLIYFLDPFAMDRNVLPLAWSTPRVQAEDAYPITPNRPTLSGTPANILRYPTQSAVFTLSGTETNRSIYIPVPSGHTFHFGMHGSASGTAAVTLTPDEGVAQNATPLTVDTQERTGDAISGVTGVTVSFAGSGTITIAGMIAQVLPDGVSVAQGGYISGRGHSGCKFVGRPKTSAYSKGLDLIGATAVLQEVGSWYEEGL